MTFDPEALTRAIDKAWERDSGDGLRKHLGASIIGRSCVRAVWYSFFWWHSVRHTGRILRLFDRGKREEAVVVENLRRVGIVVQDTDEAGRQVKFSRLWGLFGGERDGAVSNVPGLDGSGILEIKTHGEKSYKLLQDKGLLTAKPEHFVQMQLYMHWSKVQWGLYIAVNKNTDELYPAFVPYREDVAEMYTDRARRIFQSRLPPERINDDPTWWICRFCDYKRHCHGDTPPDVNCRTCEFMELRLGPDENDTAGHVWYCNRWASEIPDNFMKKGCDQWNQRC